MTFKPVIQKFAKNTEFRWLGHFLFQGLFDGEHRFFLKNNGDGTTEFEHGEKFSGILVNLFSKSLDKDTKQGFIQMNKEIKLRAEKYEVQHLV
jgi:hypothetical protein